jgi:hypothetical protein
MRPARHATQEAGELICQMIALRQGAGVNGTGLATYFSHVQEPELRIDVVRATWNAQMADTARLLAALAAAPPAEERAASPS